MGHLLTDVLVIGTGVAGCRAAIEAAAHGTVILIGKGCLTDSATAVAQGGLACAMGPDDSADEHFADTIQVGCGLSAERAVRLLVDQGPACLEEVIEWGLDADRVDGRIDLGRGTALEAMAPKLRALGHNVRVRPLTSGIQGIALGDGVLTGGADPRREGLVLGD